MRPTTTASMSAVQCPEREVQSGSQHRCDNTERSRRFHGRGRRPGDLLRRQRHQESREEGGDAVGEEHDHEEVNGANHRTHRGSVDSERRPFTRAEQPIEEAEHMWICVRLLVVDAARAPQTPVLHLAVAASLCQPEIRNVLPDALVDLLVVEDAIRPRRDKQREPDTRERHRRHVDEVRARQVLLQ